MRSSPSSLSPKKSLPLTWDSPINSLFERKIKLIDHLKGKGIKRLSDLLWLIPLRHEQIPPQTPFNKAQPNCLFSGRGKRVSFTATQNFWAKGKAKIQLFNATMTITDALPNAPKNYLTLKWFNIYSSKVKQLEIIDTFSFYGEVTLFHNDLQLVNPTIDNNLLDKKEFTEVIYSADKPLTSNSIRETIKKIPQHLWNEIPDPIPSDFLIKNSIPQLGDAFQFIHGKNSTCKNFETASKRLILEEFLFEQAKIKLRKDRIKKEIAPILSNGFNFSLTKKLLSLLPYQLTDDQSAVLKEIFKDLEAGTPMMRLIQGDVGCGKTTVAALAATPFIEEGYQIALMCPTESLALQHYLELSKYLSTILLIGGLSEKKKREVRAVIKDGAPMLVIGTHSLIQKDVTFNKLGLAIIDEQHKFGVNQRISLTSKGSGVHTLIMTATPIPRSLSLTQYGDLDISTIRTMPKNRKPISTRIVTEATMDKFLSFVKTRFTMGEQIYVVVPAIDELDPTIAEERGLNLHSVEKTTERFKSYFPEMRISAIHGRMNNEERSQLFIDFKERKIDLLIATSVIEVGINVINATVIAILNPERFGLSSLHQLRGRVGRGEKPGFCFLVLDTSVSDTAQLRLKTIEREQSGFIIAEEDLKIRGEGNLYGTEQSGISTQYKLASLVSHYDLLIMAKEIFSTDEKISSEYLTKISDLQIEKTI